MRWHPRRWAVLLAAVFAAFVFAGCSTCSFYRQAVVGQYRIVANRQPIDKVLADPQQPPELKEKLRLVLRLRAFAEADLKLPVNGHYERYVDVGRRYVVWNVHAAPPLSLEATTWWYPFVGSLKYRGYFSTEAAQRYASRLGRHGLDVYVEGVEAYSTLGWFRDPVLSTFIHHQDAVLAETLFHELAHQRVFVGGDTDFDEAFATTVGQEGARRWLQAGGSAPSLAGYLAGLRREEEFVRLVCGARQKLERAYSEPGDNTHAKQGVRDAAARQQLRQEILAELRRDYAAQKGQWGGYAGYDAWFSGPLNNAQLNTVATYFDWVPAFRQLLQENEGNLQRFYAAVGQLAKLSKKERRRRMEELLRRCPPQAHSPQSPSD